MDMSLVVVLLVTWLATMAAVQSSQPGSQNGNRLGFQRSEGAALQEWCIIGEDGFKCDMVNGADCVAVTDGSVFPFTAICKCSSTYDQYTSNSGMLRCRIKLASATTLATAKCQIDEDCQHLFPTAICNTNPTGASGTCGCPPDFIPDTTIQTKCKAFECTDDSSCASNWSPDSVCDRTSIKPVCRCKSEYFLGVASAGARPTCTDFKNTYRCDPTRPCPSPLVCDGSGKCSCPTAGNVPTLRPGTQGVADCTAPNPTIGATCTTDTECPLNAECKSIGGSRSICLCKPYFRSSPKGTDGKSTCQTMLGNCCRTAADCSTKLPQLTAGTLGSMQCLKIPTTAARGVCACTSGMFWDWNNSVTLSGGTAIVMPGCNNAAC